MDLDRSVLLSIQPRFAEALLREQKTVELRRRRPRVPDGSLLVIYSTSPVKAIIGTARLRRVEESSPGRLWQLYHEVSGVTRAEFDRYFEGSTEAIGLVVDRVKRMDTPIELADLRTYVGLQPPQSFRYLNHAQVEVILGLGWPRQAA